MADQEISKVVEQGGGRWYLRVLAFVKYLQLVRHEQLLHSFLEGVIYKNNLAQRLFQIFKVLTLLYPRNQFTELLQLIAML